MTKSEALKVKEELKALCEKYGLWWDFQEKGKPDLKDLILTVSIRVTEN